jgi:hypothetical protein
LGWIEQHSTGDMFLEYGRSVAEREVVERFFNNMENVLLSGTRLILNRIFKLTGFDRIDDEILKNLIVARICQPQSKVATVDYLKSHC